MNVEEALNAATALEAHYGMQYGNEGDNFGHPETPHVALQNLSTSPGDSSENAHLLIVYTKHCIAAQLVSHQQDNGTTTSLSPVLELGSVVSQAIIDEQSGETSDPSTLSFFYGRDEVINCLTIVELEDQNICSRKLPSVETGSKSFIFSVIVGTNHSRVLVTEMMIHHKKTTGWSLEQLHVMLEALPVDSLAVAETIRRKNTKQSTAEQSSQEMIPFQPSGGVSRLSCTYNTTVNPLETETTYIWITYADGMIVRMHHAALFPSVWSEGGEANVSVDDLLSQYNHTALLRCQVMLPPGDEQHVNIVPLPKYYPSPLAPVSFTGGKHQTCYEALVVGKSDAFPTFCVYTSEDQFWEPEPVKKSDNFMVDVVVGGTKALVGGVVGALRWASTTTDKTSTDPPESQQEIPSTPFPSIWSPPVKLFAGIEFHDMPRIVEDCAVDPDGHYAALSDSLGRVLLLDLSTKQIVRIWKGLRQASSAWIRSSLIPNHQGKSFLVLHSRQRRVVEVWPPRSDKRLASFQVHRDTSLAAAPASFAFQKVQKESRLIGRDQGVFVLDSKEATGAAVLLKSIDVAALLDGASIESNAEEEMDTASSSREATMRVQYLKQLLSSDQTEFCSKEDIKEAFCRIKSMNDLSFCLDLVASATMLEEELGVNGASFQKELLSYCKAILGERVNDATIGSIAGSAAKLFMKVEYYRRIIEAYQLLESFNPDSLEENNLSSEPLSSFAEEAIGWADTKEAVTKLSLDTEIHQAKHISFNKFASACVLTGHGTPRDLKILFSESTRTRIEILSFVFRPLLGWFSSGIVVSVFDSLGIRDQHPYLLKCFSEWFLTLPRDQIQTRCLLLPDAPMIRFVKEVVEQELASGASSSTALEAISQFCAESTDLIRAFMLASVSREVHVSISKQKDDALASSDISHWCDLVKELDGSREKLDSLIRKLRVCLLVSLRLYGEDLAPFPLSVQSLEKEKDFSVFKWIAMDELSLSRIHEEIVTLEIACHLSNHCINPMSLESDNPEVVKRLHESCLERQKEMHPPENSGSLLFFFKSYNNPIVLAAHRALLLAKEWIREPKYLQVLRHSISALKSLSVKDKTSSIAYAIRLEVWTRTIVPVYRAQLFGFAHVPEINDEEFGPLLNNKEWFTELGRMALQILAMVDEISFHPGQMREQVELQTEASNSEMVWPRPVPDYFLSVLMTKARKVEPSSLDMHTIVVCAMLFSSDTGVLSECIPGLIMSFQDNSIFNAITNPPTRDSRQEKFLLSAVVDFARSFDSVPIDSFACLQELNILATRWGFDQTWLQTSFLIAMYELGKDKVVDELMTAAVSQVLPSQLIVGGVNIVCRRLDHFLTQAKSKGEARNILGLLDAELCDWIHQRSKSSQTLVPSFANDVGLAKTQILTIRLLTLASASNADTGLRTRIHALSALTGTLVKSLEGV